MNGKLGTNADLCRKINLEQYGTGGYLMYRIPGIVSTPSGRVIAYYEAREGKGDWTKQDIYARTSDDRGASWSERKLLIGGRDDETLHNVCMIVDRVRNAIHLIWHKNYRQCFYQVSRDDGETWSDPRDITAVFERFREEYDWNVIASGPGHGIQLRNGRLLVPVWLSKGGESHRPSVVSVIYSDDGGQTWERGEIVAESDWFKMPNETTAVQLADGDVVLNMRHESDVHCRAVVRSRDGATGWSEPALERELPDPICHASLLRLVGGGNAGGDAVLFSNCAFDGGTNLRKKLWRDGKTEYYWGSQARIDLTVRKSDDDCATWTHSRLLEPYAGYSDLAASPDGKTIYCLYERDWVDNVCSNTKHMTVAVFDIDWLSEGV